MSPVQLLADYLRRLPRRVRQTIYTVWTLIGAGLAACQSFDVTDLGPITVAQALQAFAYLSPAMGAIAVANAAKPQEAEVVDYDEDFDDTSFTAAADPEGVYA
jgi:hypothetical protein